jgi:membrane protease YdiL (CAAX protease family)
MRAWVQKLSPVQEAVVVTTIFVGWFIYTAMWVVFAGFPTAAGGGGYDNGAAIALVVWESSMFALGALVLRWRGWKAGDFMFAITWRHLLAAAVLLFCSAVVDQLLWQAVGNRVDDGSVLDSIAQEDTVSFGAALLMSVVNGTFEEFFLCRYLIERFRGSGATFAVTLSACIRMMYHVYQGPFGTLSILAFGIMIGTYYWRTRALGAVVVAHILADLLALT